MKTSLKISLWVLSAFFISVGCAKKAQNDAPGTQTISTAPTPAPTPTPQPAIPDHKAEVEPTTPKPELTLVRDLKKLQIKILAKSKAEKILVQPGVKISTAISKNASLVSGAGIPRTLKKNEALCVFVSDHLEFEDKTPVLKSVKISEKTVNGPNSSTYQQLKVLMAEKDKFFMFACEKNEPISTLELINILSGVADVKFKP